MNEKDPIVIVSHARTPMGDMLGSLSSISAPHLGAATIKGCIERAQISTSEINEVIMGCVLSAGLGQAPARQAAIQAGLKYHTHTTTINKMCGSGMKAIMQAADSLKAGTNRIVIAGGMENMSQAPYLLPKIRAGYRMGHQTTIDHMFYDGLEDAYDKGTLMGVFAEKCGWCRQDAPFPVIQRQLGTPDAVDGDTGGIG